MSRGRRCQCTQNTGCGRWARRSSKLWLRLAAGAIGATLQPLAVRGPDELDNAFAIAASEKVGALLVSSHGFAVMHDRRIIEAAAKQRLPVVYGWRTQRHLIRSPHRRGREGWAVSSGQGRRQSCG